MNIQISKMSLADLNCIKDILISDFDDFWSYDILKEELNCANSSLFIAKNNNNEIVGFAGIKVILDEADIMNIVVKKVYRHKGIASLLLNHLINYSKILNLKSITLEVNEKNIHAISLYRKFNFKEIGIRKKYYNGTDDAIIMIL